MKFAIIDPQAKAFDRIEAADVVAAYREARLDPMRTDHGTLMLLENDHRVCYVVYEFGFFVPPPQQHYCAIGERLIAGRALLYEADRYGRTVNLDDAIGIDVTWFKSADEVEIAIAAGAVIRPELAVNGEVIWAWPQPAPPEFAERV